MKKILTYFPIWTAMYFTADAMLNCLYSNSSDAGYWFVFYTIIAVSAKDLVKITEQLIDKTKVLGKSKI